MKKPFNEKFNLKAEQMTANMTLEEKIGQLFFWCHIDREPREAIEKYHPGGLILFAEDFEGRSIEQVTQMIEAFQTVSKTPLLIAVDEEGGTVTRVSRFSALRESKYLSPQDLLAKGGMQAVIADAAEKSKYLRNLGINVNLTPVADVSLNKDAFIYKRVTGKDADFTADFITDVVKAMKQNHMGQSIKHFPGYSDNLDTHQEIAHDKRPLEAFEKNDLKPFTAGIEAGAESVMVAHNIVECFDDVPASLSKPVHDYLREKMGYQGVVMTDDLYMQAIQKFCDGKDACVAALLAGNDLMMTDNMVRGYDAIMEAVKEGKVDMAQVESSVARILAWKMELALI